MHSGMALRLLSPFDTVALRPCGTIVNPDVVRAQVESAIIYGLSAALFGKITIKAGRRKSH